MKMIGCNGCGACCEDFPVSKADIERIGDYIKRNPIVADFIDRKPFVPDQCIFRNNEEKKCMIYEIRPDVCISYGPDYLKVFQGISDPEFADVLRSIKCPAQDRIILPTKASIDAIIKVATQKVEGEILNISSVFASDPRMKSSYRNIFIMKYNYLLNSGRI